MKYIYIVFLIFISLNCNAQIIGVKDTENNFISKVHLKAYALDGLLIFNGFSNDGGFFENFKTTEKSIIVSAKHIGFENLKDTILVPQKNDTLWLILKSFSFPLNEVVITAQIESSSRKEAVNNIINISRKQIEQAAALNLTDILNQQAIFDIQFDPVFGSSISMQGISGNNVTILMDGIPVIGRKGSQIDISQLNLSTIEKIEIIKGPGAISYGSNSTGGVINLISKQDFKKDEFTFTSYFESVDVRQFNFDFKKKIKNQNFNFNLGQYEFFGYSEDSLRSKEWRPKKQHFGQIMWNSKIKSNEIRLKTYFFDEQIIELGNENFPPFDGTALDNYFLTYRNTNDLIIKRKNDKYSFNGLVSISKTKFKRKEYNVDLISNALDQTDNPDYNTEDLFNTLFSRVEYNRLSWNNISAQFGADLRHDKVRGDKIKDGNAETFEAAYFSKTEVQITPQLKGQIGLRLPYHSIYNAPVTPSFHLHFNKNDMLQYRVSYARGFRAPSVKELFMEFIDFNHNIVGNSELEAEYSHAFNSSISVTPYKNKNSFIQIDVEGSLQYLNNRISLAQIENTTAYTYFNISKATFYGLNSTIDAKLSLSSAFNFGWNVFITDANQLYEPMTRQNLNILYKYTSKKRNLGGNINLQINPKFTTQRFVDNELVTAEQESYNLININFYKNLNKLNTTISAGIKNLSNITNTLALANGSAHSGSESIISWGRTFFINLKLVLK